MKADKIPETDSIQELARFWATHDLTGFEDQLENVPERVFERKPETVIPVRSRRQEIEAVKRVAKTRGVRETALLRQWVRENIRTLDKTRPRDLCRTNQSCDGIGHGPTRIGGANSPHK